MANVTEQFIAHRKGNDEQLLMTHLTEVGGISAQLATKFGVPCAGELIASHPQKTYKGSLL